jgi:hypothetical protein
MALYLISFDEGWMVNQDHPDLPAIGRDVQDVCDAAEAAGVWVFGGGLLPQVATTVSPDGVVTDGPFPETKEVIGGFAVVDVATREQAHDWASKLAAACRCNQEVRELMAEPEFG